MDREPPGFLAIVGPTASGKTALSLEVGRVLGGEVVSMDSRQVYRGMDIGTGKVTLRERALLPHHGLDLRDPEEGYSAGQFARDARGWLRDIRGRGRVPLLVGGTGFFLRALLQPMFPEPGLDPIRQAALRKFLNGLPVEGLRGFVAVLDPEREALALAGGRQRMTRTVEIALLTGRPLTWWHESGEPEEPPVSGAVFLLQLPRDTLYARINGRVERMLDQGLVAEVETLLAAGYTSRDPGMTGAGYPEVVAFLEGGTSLPAACDGIRRSHRRYARRQGTWFRHQLPADTAVVDGTAPLAEQVEAVCEAWKEKGTSGK